MVIVVVCRAAVCCVVPVLEMLVAKGGQEESERKTESHRAAEEMERRTGFQANVVRRVRKRKRQRERLWDRVLGHVFERSPPLSTSPKPSGGRRKQQHEPDQTTCKGKTQTTETPQTFRV